MPVNNRRRNRRGARRNNNRNRQVVGYSAPIFRTMDKPSSMSITLHGNFPLSSGVLGTNGNISTINWIYFNDAAVIAPLYKYFEIQSCRIRFSNATTVAAEDSFIALSMAYFPINYLAEGFPTAAPTQHNAVLELDGSVYVQPGAKNYGRWFNPNIKQQFATSDAFSSSLNRVAGCFIWYCDDIGISETVGRVDVEVNVRFYQREYSPNIVSFVDKFRSSTLLGDSSLISQDSVDHIDIQPVQTKSVLSARSVPYRATKK